jgi:hypothetical protein
VLQIVIASAIGVSWRRAGGTSVQLRLRSSSQLPGAAAMLMELQLGDHHR